MVNSRTGLLLDPYFSATKISWLLDNVKDARSRAERGELAFGTIDTFLLWRLTGGAVHATDATNASRTLLYDIHRGVWDDDLLALFRIPRQILPAVLDCAADFGNSLPEHFGRPIPICGIAGDQQAAMVGEACFAPGTLKATYGTGCFALVNTGDTPAVSQHRLLTTIAYQLSGKPAYALEGSIFIAGAAIQWLRDGLGIIDTAEQSGALAAASDPAQDIYLVPAFVGTRHALLGSGLPWRIVRADALDRTRGAGESGARERVFSDSRPAGRDARRLAVPRTHLACRRRYGRFGLVIAAAG